MKRFCRLLLFLVFFHFSTAASAVSAEGSYVRVTRDKAGTVKSLDTSIYEISLDQGFKVSLVSAVHVADPGYYDSLNVEFKACDAVLYELVAPPDTVPHAGKRSSNPVSATQQFMKTVLGLEFQLDGIDYSARNFVHADMSDEELSETMRRRDESILKLFLRVMALESAGPVNLSKSGPPDLSAIFHLASPEKRALSLKRLLAPEFSEMESLSSLLDSAGGSSLLSARNDKALSVLKKEVAKGKQRLCIFYGAAHMPGMLEKLLTMYAGHPGEERWLTAWDLK